MPGQEEGIQAPCAHQFWEMGMWMVGVCWWLVEYGRVSRYHVKEMAAGELNILSCRTLKLEGK